jgi:hypothetical protein
MMKISIAQASQAFHAREKLSSFQTIRKTGKVQSRIRNLERVKCVYQ